jgi:hypothetical protein
MQLCSTSEVETGNTLCSTSEVETGNILWQMDRNWLYFKLHEVHVVEPTWVESRAEAQSSLPTAISARCHQDRERFRDSREQQCSRKTIHTRSLTVVICSSKFRPRASTVNCCVILFSLVCYLTCHTLFNFFYI